MVKWVKRFDPRKGFCKYRCGRVTAPGYNGNGNPYDTCCRECATTFGNPLYHSRECKQRKRAGSTQRQPSTSQSRSRSADRVFSYRKHRSGRLVRTDQPYRPKKRENIGFTLEQRREFDRAARLGGIPNGSQIRKLWKIYNKKEIIQKLDTLCPNHGFTDKSPKTPMLVMWLQHLPWKENKEALKRFRYLTIVQRWSGPEEPDLYDYPFILD